MSRISKYLIKLTGLSIVPKHVENFFYRIVEETIKQRKEDTLVRLDLIQLVMNIARYDGKELSVEDITALAITFLLARLESTSTTFSFIAYELAINPDVQKKLQSYIDETLKNNDGEITFELLSKLKYLDMIISEGLRKWPPVMQLTRTCVKDYLIQPANAHEKPFLIEKGTTVIIPAIGIQRDANYFPNPELFDPERFSDANKQNIEPVSCLAFGSGPRNCIGSRLAVLKLKLLFFNLLSKFDIVPVRKTMIPLKLDANLLILQPVNGLWLGLRARTPKYN